MALYTFVDIYNWAIYKNPDTATRLIGWEIQDYWMYVAIHMLVKAGYFYLSYKMYKNDIKSTSTI